MFILILLLPVVYNLVENHSEKSKNLNYIQLKEYNELPELLLSSFNTNSDKSELEFKLKMKSKYTDTYNFITKNIYQTLIYDENGTLLMDTTNSEFELSIQKNQIILINYLASSENLNILSTVKAKNHNSLLPFDPIDLKNKIEYDTSSVNADPLKPASIRYIKRPGGLYIYDNNPEELTDYDLNQAIIRKNISDIEVFFTMEHYSKIDKDTYTGFQIRNIGKDDLYVTVKNIGYQLNNTAPYYGEMEWIHFFNTKFKLIHKHKWTESQAANFKARMGFSDSHQPKNIQPITYRIPPGKHFYVLGGTTIDSYNSINVFDTADQMFKRGNINGVVLFEVKGNAEGAYFVYDDYTQVQEDNQSNMPYIVHKPGDSRNYGAQYKGYDNCHGVVDGFAKWEFNDETQSQYLPVRIYNIYKENVSLTGEPYSKIDSTFHINVDNLWHTNLNGQKKVTAIGLDMTKFITFDINNVPRVIDNDHYDGRGYLANTANWMIDYIEGYTFVNRGDKERKVTLKIQVTGSLACMIRDSEGKVIDGTQQFAIGLSQSSYGDAITDYLVYSQIVPPHNSTKFYVDYVLMAASFGILTHSVYLE